MEESQLDWEKEQSLLRKGLERMTASGIARRRRKLVGEDPEKMQAFESAWSRFDPAGLDR